MVLSYLQNVEKPLDLRAILAQNIRTARNQLHISQAKLAEHANISVSYMMDIEYCKTWVSDKTLNSIAQALKMDAYELLMPELVKGKGRKTTSLQRTADIINTKKKELKKITSEAMDDLILEIAKAENGN